MSSLLKVYCTFYYCFYVKKFQGSGIKLEMSLRRETGIGRCISALSLCNVNLFKNETGNFLINILII